MTNWAVRHRAGSLHIFTARGPAGALAESPSSERIDETQRDHDDNQRAKFQADERLPPPFYPAPARRTVRRNRNRGMPGR
jgi:hypothetical protein